MMIRFTSVVRLAAKTQVEFLILLFIDLISLNSEFAAERFNVMGKRIVINAYGTLGDLKPFFSVAKGLQARGHRVTIAADDFSRPTIESAGVEFQHVRRSFVYGNEDPNSLKLYTINNGYKDLMAAVRRADLLITHHVSLAGPLVADSTGIPWLSVALCPHTLSAYHQPLTFGASSGNYRFTPAVYKLYLDQMNQMKMVSHFSTMQVQRFRRRLGLGLSRDVLFEAHHSPNGVLATFSSAFAAPQSHWPPQTCVTGFPFDERETEDAALPPELETFLNDGPPPIVFTLGSASIFDDGSFRHKSITAASMLGRRAVLLGSIPGRKFPNNSHVMSVEYAPHDALLSRAAAIVHHGGIGTTAAAMRAGCPMLMLPGYCWDQPENAARAAGLGVARMLALHEYNALSASAELAHLLNNPGYAEKAAELKRIIQAEDGVRSACDEIEQYLTRIG